MAPRNGRTKTETKSTAKQMDKVATGRLDRKSRKSPEKSKHKNGRVKWNIEDRVLVYEMRCKGIPYPKISPLLERSGQALRLVIFHAADTLRDLDKLDDDALIPGLDSDEANSARRMAAEKRAAAYKKTPGLERAAELKLHKMAYLHDRPKPKPKRKRRTRAAVPDPSEARTQEILPAGPQPVAVAQPTRDPQLTTASPAAAAPQPTPVSPDAVPYSYDNEEGWRPYNSSLYYVKQEPSRMPQLNGSVAEMRPLAYRPHGVFVPPHPQLLPPTPTGSDKQDGNKDSSSPVNKMSTDFVTE